MSLFGGRGASSSYGKEGFTTNGDGKSKKFYDKTDKYKGMSYLEYEEIIRNRKTEWIGLYDDNGKIIIAGTSYDKHSVSIPTTHPDFKKATNITHNHPSDGKTRYLGGPLSEADVMNGIYFNYNNSRAVAKEKTYTLNKGKNVTKRQQNQLYLKANRMYKNDTWGATSRKTMMSVNKKLKSQGKTISSKTYDQISLGTGTRLWKEAVKGTGYNYIERKNK